MTVLIEMVSDLVCPWCWLGLRRLDAAIEQIGDELDVHVVYRPYQLDPTVPLEGMDYKAYMTSKFGGTGDSAEAEARKDRFSEMRSALEDYGKAEGIPFQFSGITRRPNTLNAHRLVRWAQGQDRGHAAKEALFNAYFTDHRDIGDLGVLSDIASEIGLDRALVTDLLNGPADIEATAKEEAFYRQLGIGGVPTYIANQKVAAQGAEDTEKLVKFIRTAAKEYPLEKQV